MMHLAGEYALSQINDMLVYLLSFDMRCREWPKGDADIVFEVALWPIPI